jgi:Tol biopolymer transport system component
MRKQLGLSRSGGAVGREHGRDGALCRARVSRSTLVGATVALIAAGLWVGGALGSASSRAHGPVGKVAFDLDFLNGKPGGWIEVANLDGSHRRTLTPAPSQGDHRTDNAVSWSPDGTRLVFVRSGVPAAQAGYYVVNSDGTGLHRILSSEQEFAAWSPDGSKIAFWTAGTECALHAGRTAPRLWISSADGRPATELPPLLAAVDAGFANAPGAVHWSPNGRQLFYTIGRYSTGDVCRGATYMGTAAYTIGVNGSGLLLRLPDNHPIEDAAWAPEGRRVALLTDDGVFICGLTAGGASRLVYRFHLVQFDATTIDWASRTLIFSSPLGIRVYALSTKSSRLILRQGRGLNRVYAVSPDGAWVAAGTGPPDRDYVVSADGKNQRPIWESAGSVPNAAISGNANQVTIHLG